MQKEQCRLFRPMHRSCVEQRCRKNGKKRIKNIYIYKKSIVCYTARHRYIGPYIYIFGGTHSNNIQQYLNFIGVHWYCILYCVVYESVCNGDEHEKKMVYRKATNQQEKKYAHSQNNTRFMSMCLCFICLCIACEAQRCKREDKHDDDYDRLQKKNVRMSVPCVTCDCVSAVKSGTG